MICPLCQLQAQTVTVLLAVFSWQLSETLQLVVFDLLFHFIFNHCSGVHTKVSFFLIPDPFCMQRPSTLSMSNPLRKEGESAALYPANRKIKRKNSAAPWQNKNRLAFSISSGSGESKDMGSEVRKMQAMWTDRTREKSKSCCAFSSPMCTLNAEARIWNQIMNTREISPEGVLGDEEHVHVSVCLYSVCMCLWSSVVQRHTKCPLANKGTCDLLSLIPSIPTSLSVCSSICLSQPLSHYVYP